MLDFISEEERNLSRRFHTFIDSRDDPHAGGLVINCLGSSNGHCYQDHAGAFKERVTIPDTVSPEVREQMDKAGADGAFKYNVMSVHERGIAVVGLFLEQGGFGYIYNPLKQ